MKRTILLLLLILSWNAFSQTSYTYTQARGFAIADSLVGPMYCTVDSSGNAWVASTNVVSGTGIHGLFKAAPGDSLFTLVVRFTTADSIKNITGLAAHGNDIFISARRAPDSAYTTPLYYPYSEVIYLPGGDTSGMITFKQPEYKDYGTWYNGIAVSDDGFIYFGQSYLVTLGTIDGRKASSSFGSTVGYTYGDWSTSLEPGGGLTYPNVLDQIRDIALYSDSSYADTATVIFTSRNSSADETSSSTGGIAAWTGASESSPYTYHAVRVSDISGFLTLGTSMPYGISIDPATGYLFVCGTDSTRMWVKGFQIVGDFAVQIAELPSSTSRDVQDAAGAPFVAPADVAFSPNGSLAYVVDEGVKKVFTFASTATGVASATASAPSAFVLHQNYPNPFNPTTTVTFDLPSSERAKIEVFNILGERVAQLADNVFTAGTHVVSFNASGLASGVYLCRTQVGRLSQTIKMALVR